MSMPEAMKLEDEEEEEFIELDTENYADFDPICYPTLFHNLNIRLGKNIRDAAGGLIGKARGVRESFRCMITGVQNVGKTTLACNIIGGVKYVADTMNEKNGLPSRAIVHVVSTEGGMDVSEMIKNMGVSNKALNNKEVIFHNPAKVTTEYFVDLVKGIHKDKMENKDKYKHIGRTVLGRMKTSTTPTIILLDSVSMMFPAELKGKPVTNMIAAQQNKDNGYYMELLNSLFIEANIMVFFILHVSKSIPTGMFDKPSRTYQNIKADINISGGRKVQYICDCGIFLNKIVTHDDMKDNVRTELNVEDEFLVNAIECKFFKNRCGSSTARNDFSLVSDMTMGFSPKYSLLYEIANMNPSPLVKVNASRWNLEGWDGDNFFKKDVPELFEKDPAFRRILLEKYEEKFEYLLEAHNKSKERHEAAREFMSDLLGF